MLTNYLQITLINSTNPATIVGALRAPFSNEMKSDTDLGSMTLGENDLCLAQKLISRGDSHAKFMRQLHVHLRVVGPRYWWQEFSTHRAGVEMVSQSSRYSLSHSELTQDDFADDIAPSTLRTLTYLQKEHNWYKLKQLIPECYLQTRYVDLTYQALRNIHVQRKDHWLPEWKYFTNWIEGTIPLAQELITFGL
jgi:hypothetical protein